MRAGFALAIVVASCGDNAPPVDAPFTFEYRATFGWYAAGQPYILSVTVDGTDLPSGEQYVVEHVYASYDDALADFRPRRVVATTTSGVQEFQFVPDQCMGLVNEGQLVRPIVLEDDRLGLGQVYMDPTKLFLASDCGWCADRHIEIGSCTRAGAP